MHAVGPSSAERRNEGSGLTPAFWAREATRVRAAPTHPIPSHPRPGRPRPRPPSAIPRSAATAHSCTQHPAPSCCIPSQTRFGRLLFPPSPLSYRLASTKATLQAGPLSRSFKSQQLALATQTQLDWFTHCEPNDDFPAGRRGLSRVFSAFPRRPLPLRRRRHGHLRPTTDTAPHTSSPELAQGSLHTRRRRHRRLSVRSSSSCS